MSNEEALIREIEERKRVENELRTGYSKLEAQLRDSSADLNLANEQRLQLAAIVESSEDAIIGCSLAGHVTIWNRGAERLFGYSADEVIGEVTSTNPRLHWPEEMKALKRVRKGEYVPPLETVRRRKDGTEVHVSVSISPIRERDGRIVGASLICRDVSERKRLERQVVQSQKMEAIGQLAGGVAHDFNNLLTIINGYSELLLNRLAPGDPMRQLLGEINRAGERAGTLTRQLLAFSRQQVLEPKVLDFNAVVSDMEKMLRRLIGEDIILTYVPSPTGERVKVDPGQLEQILMNLAVNARDAMPQGGRITIETRSVMLDELYVQCHPGARSGEHALLAVSDTGCGMDDAIKAHIFEPFFTTKGPGKGTGLGLATVYGIVKQSGGCIDVYSELGRGTTFKIYFPLVREPVSVAKSYRGLRLMPHGSETVLLVEDEDAVRSLARHVLRSCGYTVLEADDGQRAVQLVEDHRGPIDLVVSDVVMPYLGGRQLVERLAALRPGLKVLFMSGYTDDAVVRHGVLATDYAFLQKPFTPTALAQRVREVLGEAGEGCSLCPRNLSEG
jgi:two-component system, cell cycle sensor histidine kinase and response regulator CckA